MDEKEESASGKKKAGEEVEDPAPKPKKRKGQPARSIHAHIKHMVLLCQASLFSKHPLEVHVLGETASAAIAKNKVEDLLPSHVPVINDFTDALSLQAQTIENLDTQPQIFVGGKEQTLTTHVKATKSLEADMFQDMLAKYNAATAAHAISLSQLPPPPSQLAAEVCGLSNLPINPKEDLVTICRNCGVRSLLTELARHALSNSSDKETTQVLPVTVTCYSCNEVSSWKEVARMAVLFRKYLATKSLEEEDVDEEADRVEAIE